MSLQAIFTLTIFGMSIGRPLSGVEAGYDAGGR
jgi:hypothetical protein